MAGRKLIYLLLMAITAYIGLMYDSTVPGMVLAFELLLFILLFILSFFLTSGVEIHTDSASDGVVETGDKAKILFTVTNNGVLPVSSMHLHVIVRNRLEDEEEEYEMNLRIPSGSTVRVPFTFSSSYCGVVRVNANRLKVYDYLRLFSRKKKLHLTKECVIMPRLHELQVAISEDCLNYDSDSDEYDKNRPGDDPSEIFRMREYRRGDKMSRVNWKMSARLDTLMIKEISRPVTNAVGIYLDLRYGGIEEAQAVFELCYSLSMALLAQECYHRIFWCKHADPVAFETVSVRSAEDLTEAMAKLLTSGKREQHLYWDIFRQASGRLNVHRMICVTGMDPDEDMAEFLEPDDMVKTVLTINDLQDLIVI